MTTYLFIFESIGTSELILIGIVALIVFGPRKLPGLAKTLGKTMADFRKTTNEFKETWQREVDIEKVESSENPRTIAKSASETPGLVSGPMPPPMISNIDEASIADHFSPENRDSDEDQMPAEPDGSASPDKRNWI